MSSICFHVNPCYAVCLGKLRACCTSSRPNTKQAAHPNEHKSQGTHRRGSTAIADLAERKPTRRPHVALLAQPHYRGLPAQLRFIISRGEPSAIFFQTCHQPSMASASLGFPKCCFPGRERHMKAALKGNFTDWKGSHQPFLLCGSGLG